MARTPTAAAPPRDPRWRCLIAGCPQEGQWIVCMDGESPRIEQLRHYMTSPAPGHHLASTRDPAAPVMDAA
jgi:hypothetical protein